MPHEVKCFCCDICNEPFDDFFTCLMHETKCNPCITCKNALWIDNTKFECKYQKSKKCNSKNRIEYVKRGE